MNVTSSGIINGVIQPQYGGHGTQFNENGIPTYSLPFAVEDAPLSALNALLNMDEKGGDALGMDDAPEEENEGQETSGHDVQKSGQEEEASIKPETGESSMDMPIPYPVENAGHNYAVDNGKPQGAKLAAAMADKPVQRTSLREKLEAFKAKVSGTDKLSIEKAKGKEETL